MKKSKFAEAQIVFAIKQSETVPVEEICRKMGISQVTYYNWKKKYGGLDPSELRRTGYGRLLRHGLDMDMSGFTRYYGGRGGRIISSVFIGFIRKKD